MRIYPIAASLALAAALAACGPRQSADTDGDTPASGTPAAAPTRALIPAIAAPKASGTAGDTDGAETPAKIPEKRLAFATGKQSATIEGSIKGRESVDYLLAVKAGQAMNVSIASGNPGVRFRLMEPGESQTATFDGADDGNQFEGVAGQSGDYRIRVYLMHDAAQREDRAVYRLEAIVN
ncbi:hypothetical protein RXV95_03830 [Novosphingobium sp. ZN18A2]|uniref:hypothetical protein n=1 Tax=Novosphingobium sp. ZN18A2 TaxID=3079861 RepID=UPI0030D1D735